MKNFIKRFVNISGSAILISLACSGCSGGGSGSGDAGRTAVRIIHAAIDTAPLDLYSSEEIGLIGTSKFGAQAKFFNVNRGNQVFSLTVSQTSRTVFSVPLTVIDKQRQTILAYGNRDNLGLRVNTLIDDPGEVSGDQSALRVVHALVGAAQIDCQMVGAIVCGDLEFGNAAIYSKIAAGDGRITIKRSADKKVVFDADLSFEGGKAYSLIIMGEVDYFVRAPLLQDN